MRKGRFLIFLLALGLYCLTADARADWSATKRLTWNSGASSQPAIAMDSTNAVHVVWRDDTPGNYELYHKKSTDGGTSWSTAKRLTWTSGFSYGQVIAIDSADAIHVVWIDDTSGSQEVYYKRSTDAGATWTQDQALTSTSTFHQYPAIAIDSSDAIHVAWEDDTVAHSYEIFYRRSTDGGATWSAAQRLSWTPLSGSYSPALATKADNTVHIVWEDAATGNWEIYYKKSTDGGANWSTAKRLTWNSGSSYSPAIALDSTDGIHVVWYDDTPGNYEVCYKRSTDGGANWSALKNLTGTSGLSEHPAIALDSSNAIHVVWDEWALGEVYYRKSTDGGLTWTATTRLTWTSGRSEYIAMAIGASDTIHVVWQDDAPFNWEIYYKKGT